MLNAELKVIVKRETTESSQVLSGLVKFVSRLLRPYWFQPAVVLKGQQFSRAYGQGMKRVRNDLERLQIWIQSLVNDDCVVLDTEIHNAAEIVVLLKRCTQVLWLITLPDKAVNFEWGLLYGLTLFQLVSTTVGQERIELLLFTFASQGTFTMEKK